MSLVLPLNTQDSSVEETDFESVILSRINNLISSHEAALDLVLSEVSPDQHNAAVERLVLLRAENLFEVMRDFPESEQAVADIKQCLAFLGDVPAHWRWLSTEAISQLRQRLLIPGAHTKDILRMYVRVHKSCAAIFPQAHKARVTETTLPIVQELLKRRDSIKCVVAALLGEDDDDLIDEQEIPEPEVDDWEWTPPPTCSSDQTSKESMVSLLVGVFGGREKFLTEFKSLLAEKLLLLSNFEAERETQSVELMKIKFGEDDLVDCQVMLRDVAQSKRTNALVNGVSPVPLSTLLISRHFWPNFQTSRSPPIPPVLADALQKFSANFKTLRPSQRIEWRPQGTVTIAVSTKCTCPKSCGSHQQEFKVSLMELSVLSAFEDGQKRTVEAVAQNLEISGEEGKRLVGLWATRGVLREVDVNTYQSVDGIN